MIEHSPAAVLHRAAKNIERLLMFDARQMGLTPNLLRVLLALTREPGLTAAELGRQLGFDKASSLYVVRELHARGLITRTEDKADPKALRNLLTAKGTKAAAGAAAILQRIDVIVGGIVEAPRLTCQAKLERLAAIQPPEKHDAVRMWGAAT